MWEKNRKMRTNKSWDQNSRSKMIISETKNSLDELNSRLETKNILKNNS